MKWVQLGSTTCNASGGEWAEVLEGVGDGGFCAAHAALASDIDGGVVLDGLDEFAWHARIHLLAGLGLELFLGLACDSLGGGETGNASPAHSRDRRALGPFNQGIGHLRRRRPRSEERLRSSARVRGARFLLMPR